jgi:hypothetical protein
MSFSDAEIVIQSFRSLRIYEGGNNLIRNMIRLTVGQFEQGLFPAGFSSVAHTDD